MEEKEKPKSNVGTIIRIGLIAFGLFFLASMYIPGYIRYRPKQFCAWAESDANNIAATIADYFSIPDRTRITPDDLAGFFEPINPWTLTQCGQKIYIYVYDHHEDCTIAYQNTHPHWNEHIYTKVME